MIFPEGNRFQEVNKSFTDGAKLKTMPVVLRADANSCYFSLMDGSVGRFLSAGRNTQATHVGWQEESSGLFKLVTTGVSYKFYELLKSTGADNVNNRMS